MRRHALKWDVWCWYQATVRSASFHTEIVVDSGIRESPTQSHCVDPARASPRWLVKEKRKMIVVNKGGVKSQGGRLSDRGTRERACGRVVRPAGDRMKAQSLERCW